MGDSALYVPPQSAIAPLAETLGWLWRLPLEREPNRKAVGIGTLDDAPALRSLLDARRLAGVAVIGARPGPDQGPLLPGRVRVRGVARFGPRSSVSGQFAVLHGPGTPVVRSSLGVHAIRDNSWLTVGADPISSWGTVQDFWLLPALADFFADVLERPMAMLPPIGVVRFDDAPGTAAQQLEGWARSDRRVEGRLRRMIDAYASSGAKLNFAIAARALVDGDEVPSEAVWPRSIAQIRAAIERGVAEPVCHGYLHLDMTEHQQGRIESREFASLDRAEASRRVRAALDWASGEFGIRPPTFVAPNWTYGEGVLAALEELDLPAWLPAGLGPLVAGGNARETLSSTLDGLHHLDYGPLTTLAAAGLPIYVVVHSKLFDARLAALSSVRDLPTLARLRVRGDLFRLTGVPGIRWVTASEMLEHLRAHDQVEIVGRELRAPDGVRVALREAP